MSRKNSLRNSKKRKTNMRKRVSNRKTNMRKRVSKRKTNMRKRVSKRKTNMRKRVTKRYKNLKGGGDLYKLRICGNGDAGSYGALAGSGFISRNKLFYLKNDKGKYEKLKAVELQKDNKTVICLDENDIERKVDKGKIYTGGDPIDDVASDGVQVPLEQFTF